MFNKRGISPIIATMLLVALAVAVGTSFVSYAGSYFEQKSINKAAECKDYLINFFELDKAKSFCEAQSNAPYAVKFGYNSKPVSQSKCYISVASGTSRICNGKILADNTWIQSKDANI